ncbi:SigE family RNA polymerase sigma factor [Nocardioides immobilis]|uniref:SigE family RNA polymerase sigma factor n=1 Tax=Nocardioides immobilis TaxID=2049295 RepID=A0A417Y398_9ACTN|nr:SigE family RNA polymerase sigma factor [Nocardioides immobilis]RHW27138.1 SigE family RNA polymerase sigma factor [Nocardioides immobilis]
MTSDEEAFRQWAGERQLGLLRTALLLTGDHHRAEDLVQEALTKVALRWRRLAAGNPDGYARQILVRDNISAWRKTRREVVVADPTDIRGPDPTAGVDRRILLDRALATLTPRQRAVIVLRFYDDLTERDAAEAMGVSVGTVKSQTHLALRRLRDAAPELAELLREESP